MQLICPGSVMITRPLPEWGLSTQRIADKGLAARLYDIVSRKTTFAREQDCTIPLHSATTYYLSLVSGPLLGAQLIHGEDGQCSVAFTDEDGPALMIDTEPGGKMVTLYFAGARPDSSLIEQRLCELEKFELLTPEVRPYGWVEGDRITALLFSSRVMYEDKQFVGGSPSTYVLQGTEMPGMLRMLGEGDLDWPHRVLGAIQTGQLVPLRKRIHELPGEVWSVVGGNGKAYIQFDEGDEVQPSLVAGTPYVKWHPLEKYPCELFTTEDEGRLPIREWLSR